MAIGDRISCRNAAEHTLGPNSSQKE